MVASRAVVPGLLVLLASCWSGGLDESPTVMSDVQLSSLSCGTTQGGELRCWGQIPAPLGSSGRTASPVRVPAGGAPRLVLARSRGGGFGCGLERDGTAWCWGNNAWGALGNGTAGGSAGLTRAAQPEPFTDIAPGGFHVCALGRSSVVYCWGLAQYLGLPVSVTPEDCITGSGRWVDTVPCITRPTPVDASARFEALALGDQHACAVSEVAELWCWGDNQSGATGIGDTTGYVARPTRVPALAGVSSVSAASGSTCAGANGGAVWCWGSSYSGSLGTGDVYATLYDPTEVPRPDGIQLHGVALAESHACALDQDDRAWCWGTGLGVGNASSGTTAGPVTVLGNLRFKQVAAAPSHDFATRAGTSCGVADDGTWCWGGSAGDGSGQPQAIPVRVAGQGSPD